jgi:uncharacterized protein
MNNVQVIESIYGAFGIGDIPAILARLSVDVEWEYGMVDAEVPWLAPRRGRAGVAQFFESLSALEFRKFEPRLVMGSAGVVVALIDIEFVVKATGIAVAEEHEVHLWHFGGDGLVNRFCHKLDSYQHWKASHAR